jgi:hypothetical protein
MRFVSVHAAHVAAAHAIFLLFSRVWTLAPLTSVNARFLQLTSKEPGAYQDMAREYMRLSALGVSHGDMVGCVCISLADSLIADGDGQLGRTDRHLACALGILVGRAVKCAATRNAQDMHNCPL